MVKLLVRYQKHTVVSQIFYFCHNQGTKRILILWSVILNFVYIGVSTICDSVHDVDTTFHLD